MNYYPRCSGLNIHFRELVVMACNCPDIGWLSAALHGFVVSGTFCRQLGWGETRIRWLWWKQPKLWLVILLHPSHRSLELGCFHGDRVFDRQVRMRWSVHFERGPPLWCHPQPKDQSSTGNNLRNRACLLSICIFLCTHTHTHLVPFWMLHSTLNILLLGANSYINTR